jgi:hypothetical protein
MIAERCCTLERTRQLAALLLLGLVALDFFSFGFRELSWDAFLAGPVLPRTLADGIARCLTDGHREGARRGSAAVM